MMKMTKKLSVLLSLLLAFVLVLGSCTGAPTPGPDTDTETETETSPAPTGCEAGDHTWKDATCVDTKFCELCGETAGCGRGHFADESAGASVLHVFECGDRRHQRGIPPS